MTTTLSEALEEAYASNPSDVVILDTLELIHPDFKDEDGNQAAVRVVRDNVNLRAFLEDDAPLNAGQEVEFVALGFDLEFPPVNTTPVPEITVTLDNVGREIIKYLDMAASSQDMIKMIYRPYLSTDLSVPQMIPPLTLVLSDVQANITKITAKARMMDIGTVSYTHLRAHETDSYLVCRLLLEKKKKDKKRIFIIL